MQLGDSMKNILPLSLSKKKQRLYLSQKNPLISLSLSLSPVLCECLIIQPTPQPTLTHPLLHIQPLFHAHPSLFRLLWDWLLSTLFA
jgi:hypothetical protein